MQRYRPDAVTHGAPDRRQDGGRGEGPEAREVTACRLEAPDGRLEDCVAGPPELVLQKVEVMEALAYHALWS